MLYFGQDGCPYCQALMATNFSQRSIVEKTRRHFVAVALNLWGDRETTWIDGRTMSESAGAATRRTVHPHASASSTSVARLSRGSMATIRRTGSKRCSITWPEGTSGTCRSPRTSPDMSGSGQSAPDRRGLLSAAAARPSTKRRRQSRSRFSSRTVHCGPCDELHRDGLQRPSVRALLDQFDVARFAFGAPTRLTTPAGQVTTARAWATELGVTFAPTIVFFAADGREVFRIDAYLRPFHLESSLDYVASGAYRD